MIVRLSSVFVLALCAACASGGGDATPDASPAPDLPDASPAPTDAAAPDAPATPDAATPDASMDPDACVPTMVDVLTDGDLDASSAQWVQQTDGANPLIRSSLPYPAHSGVQAVLFMGYNNANQSLRQTISIPADATALRLRGFHCLVTEEMSMTMAFDSLRIELQQVGGGLVEQLAEVTNLDAAAVCDWTMFEFNAADAHAGQTLDLVFEATSDNASITSMGIDTMALEAMACP